MRYARALPWLVALPLALAGCNCGGTGAADAGADAGVDLGADLGADLGEDAGDAGVEAGPSCGDAGPYPAGWDRIAWLPDGTRPRDVRCAVSPLHWTACSAAAACEDLTIDWPGRIDIAVPEPLLTIPGYQTWGDAEFLFFVILVDGTNQWALYGLDGTPIAAWRFRAVTDGSEGAVYASGVSTTASNVAIDFNVSPGTVIHADPDGTEDYVLADATTLVAQSDHVVDRFPLALMGGAATGEVYYDGVTDVVYSLSAAMYFGHVGAGAVDRLNVFASHEVENEGGWLHDGVFYWSSVPTASWTSRAIFRRRPGGANEPFFARAGVGIDMLRLDASWATWTEGLDTDGDGMLDRTHVAAAPTAGSLDPTTWTATMLDDFPGTGFVEEARPILADGYLFYLSDTTRAVVVDLAGHRRLVLVPPVGTGGWGTFLYAGAHAAVLTRMAADRSIFGLRKFDLDAATGWEALP